MLNTKISGVDARLALLCFGASSPATPPNNDPVSCQAGMRFGEVRLGGMRLSRKLGQLPVFGLPAGLIRS